MVKPADDSQRINQELYKRNVELAFRNKTLTLLRELYEIAISSVTTLEELGHKLVNAIRGELNLDFTALLVPDEAKKYFRPLASSVSPELQKLASRYITLDDAFRIDLTNQYNACVRAYTTQKRGEADKLGEIIAKTIPALFEKEIEKHTKIATAVVYPLVVNGSSLGVLLVSLRQKFSELPRFEQEAIDSFANVVTIALDKAMIYGELQEANAKLEDLAVRLSDANENLKKLDEAKSNFVSIASHQLRTPVTGIKGYLSMLREGDFGKLTPKQSEVIALNLENIERLVKLIDVFLDISRIEAGRLQLYREDAHMEPMIDSVLKELVNMADRKKLVLKKNIKAKLPTVYIDPEKVRHVVLNLVDNAIKYTPAGSITVTGRKEKDGITIEVKDSGIGVAKEELSKLFGKFVRAGGGVKTDANGAGLGLFIIKSIVEAHSGRAWVDSEGEGKGTTFGFFLPGGAEVKKADEAAKAEAAKQKQQK